MFPSTDSPIKVQPLVLAAGLGTRLRPRTLSLPKPLLPVDGRPLLWYALRTATAPGLLQPIVVVGPLGDLIEAYFDGWAAEFVRVDCSTMLEALFSVVDRNKMPDAFLCMSSDVLVPKRLVSEILQRYFELQEDTVLFVKLPRPGHKKWDFIVHDGALVDIRVQQTQTIHERALLLVNRRSVDAVRTLFPSPLTDTTLPQTLVGYQTGWNLLMKSMLQIGIPVHAEFIDIPVCNVNQPHDFVAAEEFVRSYGPW